VSRRATPYEILNDVSLTIRRSIPSRLKGAALAYAFAVGVWLFPCAARSAEKKNDLWQAVDRSSVMSSGRGSGALADFDGDHRADLALALPQGLFNGAYRYRVDVHLSTDLSTTFVVDSGAAGGLHIMARDVDGDRDLDLVITSEFGREPVGIWINDGHGAFTKGRPGVYIGSMLQEPDFSWELPRRRHPKKGALGFPSGSWITEPARLAALVLSDNLILRVAVDAPAHSTLNLGSPFRAPPIS